MVILLLSACNFGSPSSDDPAGGATEDTRETEGPRGSVVSTETTIVRFTADTDEVPVETPSGATFVRVDSCTDDTEDERMVCDSWDGGYHLYDDGELILTPSVWDGDIAQVTWLVIE